MCASGFCCRRIPSSTASTLGKCKNSRKFSKSRVSGGGETNKHVCKNVAHLHKHKKREKRGKERGYLLRNGSVSSFNLTACDSGRGTSAGEGGTKGVVSGGVGGGEDTQVFM